MVGLRIENLTRHEGPFGPYYTADVVNGAERTRLSRRYGSWLTVDARREAQPLVAAMLQRAVGKLERAEGRAA